jgi:hypothetical protein
MILANERISILSYQANLLDYANIVSANIVSFTPCKLIPFSFSELVIGVMSIGKKVHVTHSLEEVSLVVFMRASQKQLTLVVNICLNLKGG